MRNRAATVALFTLVVAILSSSQAKAFPIVVGHDTNGQFDNGEWTGPNVSATFFPVVGPAGGAWLYVEQSGGALYLMYDYVNSAAGGFGQANSFFDVFFQVPSDHEDYVAQFNSTTISLFVKDTGTVSTLNPDGSLTLTSSPWTLDNADLSNGDFKAAIGFGKGITPDSQVSDHVLAEFQLSVNTAPTGSTPNGFYDPSPAFWSASVASAADPPISSAIFTLNPDGTTTVTPALGPNGGPVLQPQDVVPEPSGVAIFLGLGAIGLFGYRRKLIAR